LLHWFEQRLDPFPGAEPSVPPQGLISFLWACTRGARRYVAALAVLSASVSVSVQKIGEGRGNTRNSIPDVEMNNLPLTLSLPALHLLLCFP